MLSQIAIALTGVTAIWLTQQHREDWKRYAALFGIAGQPFWLYVTFTSEQWGMFALSCCYTYAWCVGIYNHWFRTKRQQ